MSFGFIQMCPGMLAKILTMKRGSLRSKGDREGIEGQAEMSERRVPDLAQLLEEKMEEHRYISRLSHWGPFGCAPLIAPLANLLTHRGRDFPPSPSICMLSLDDFVKSSETLPSPPNYKPPHLFFLVYLYYFILRERM